MKKVKLIFPLIAAILAVIGVFATETNSKSIKHPNTSLVMISRTGGACSPDGFCEPGGSFLCTYQNGNPSVVGTLEQYVPGAPPDCSNTIWWNGTWTEG